MPVDPILVKRKIVFISRDIKQLKKIYLIPLAKYIAKDEYEVLAERYLERIISRMIDINYHILVQRSEIMPVDYYTSFIEMGKQGFIPKKLSFSLAKAAGLRNRLAHEYDEIDIKQVYQAIGRATKEVPKYLDSILKILEKKSKQKRLV